MRRARAGAVVQAVHRYVHGTTQCQLGPFPPGTPYAADNPELMLWVHATLVHASLAAYQTFERRLSADQRESYYRDMALVAEIFGVPKRVIPRTLADFHEYFEAQVAGSSITVTPIAEQIASVILRAPLPAPLRLYAPAHRLATTAFLPPRLRREYGLPWTPRERLLLRPAGWSLKLTATPVIHTASRLRLAAVPG